MSFVKAYKFQWLTLIGSTAGVLFVVWFTLFFKKPPLAEKPIVAVITSFNNAQWVYKNLDSIFSQDYANFRVVYLDDCSTDETARLVEQYVKEKNVADKVTLIKNKERAIKILNLYNIHHSINDWDIIAQIDGDDWLAHNQVFKLVNEEYCKGCWMAYTQFETSNGHKGSNAYPPYLVRKTGSFRTYKPWFMYSHLKTFYAWLFKQIKLQDLLDDREGIFQPVDDDVLMMYPMLEMACEHVSFIPKSCYVFNVDPGYKPRLRQASNNLFEAILKRAPYAKLENPVARAPHENFAANVDGILLAHHADPKVIEEKIHALEDLKVAHIYVAHQLKSEGIKNLKTTHPNITFIPIADISAKTLQPMHDYLVLMHATDKLSKEISLPHCIEQLEKTGAFSFCFNLNCGTFAEKNCSCQPIGHSVCAWKFGCTTNMETDTGPLLCRKKDVVRSPDSFFNLESSPNIHAFIQTHVVDKNMVGLFFGNTKHIAKAA